MKPEGTRAIEPSGKVARWESAFSFNKYESCIDVENVAEIVLFVATRDSSVTIPQIAIYPTHKIHRYGMEV
jgi:NADP-dependent 3-hydroxy acid dehydrogenase YdfG